MAIPIVDVTLTNGKGIPVTEVAPIAPATVGRGMPVTVATNGFGIPVVYVLERGIPVVTV